MVSSHWLCSALAGELDDREAQRPRSIVLGKPALRQRADERAGPEPARVCLQ